MMIHQAQKVKESWQLVLTIFLLVLAAGGLSGCRMPAAVPDPEPTAAQQQEGIPDQTAADLPDPTEAQKPTQTAPAAAPEDLPVETAGPEEDHGLDATYHDPELEFSFDYPGEWERGYEERGVRGGFFTFIDPEGSPAEILAQVTIYRWDPIQDLDAYREKRRASWESSQAEILQETDWTWGEGIPGKTFRFESLEGEIVDVYLTYTGDYYLEFTTTSEFERLAMVVSTLR